MQIFLNQFQVHQKYEKNKLFNSHCFECMPIFVIYMGIFIFVILILLASFYGYFYTHKFYIRVQFKLIMKN